MLTLVTVSARSLPTISRHCSGCHATRDFACSERFRVNANGRRIDVWLIYRCMRCDTRFNREIHARVPARSLRDLPRYESNDAVLVAEHAFDPGLAGAVRDVDVTRTDAEELVFALDRPIALRLDRAIAMATGMSRTRVSKLIATGALNLHGARPSDRVRSGQRVSRAT